MHIASMSAQGVTMQEDLERIAGNAIIVDGAYLDADTAVNEGAEPREELIRQLGTEELDGQRVRVSRELLEHSGQHTPRRPSFVGGQHERERDLAQAALCVAPATGMGFSAPKP